MEESGRIPEFSIGDPEERASSAVVLPFCPTVAYTTPVCDEAMDEESCMLFMSLYVAPNHVKSVYFRACCFMTLVR
jgi:hypothetical protein